MGQEQRNLPVGIQSFEKIIENKYPYMTLNDKTEITFSDIRKKGRKNTMTVYFERPVRDGFVSAECSVPDYTWDVKGLTADEIVNYQEFVKRNEASLMKFARNGGTGLDV